MSEITKKTKDTRKTGKRRFLKILKSSVLILILAAFVLIVANLKVSVSSADVACDCSSCHTTPHNASCSGCHDSPPQTGTHLVHYGSAPLDSLPYGDTGVSSTDLVYKFGCGNCHPLDQGKHGDGVIEVELFDPSAPAGSIKSMNPAGALYAPGSTTTTYVKSGMSFSYSNGTCNNVYCHSGYTIVSGPVSLPTGTDQYGNLTYAPYTVTRTRVYRATPTWGTNSDSLNTTFTACTECHEFPLTTSYPSVQAGVGDSHQWIDDYGYGNLHAFNMNYDPLGCRTCHYGTVTAANAWAQDPMDVTTYSKVSLASRQNHVTGSAYVNFDTVNLVSYGTKTYSLSGASYDAASKTCSNVACHKNQTSVTWGAPYRWWSSPECTLCHTY